MADRRGARPSVAQSRLGGSPVIEALTASIERMDWPEVRRIADESAQSKVINWREKALIASNAADWVAVLQVESGVVEESGVDSVEGLPPAQLRLAIQARQRLELFEEARGLSKTARERMPNRPEWLRREVDALFNLGEHQDALSLAFDAWRDRVEFAPLLIVRNLLALEAFDKCQAFLEEIRSAFQGSEPIEVARARLSYFEAVQDYDSIERELNALRGGLPEHEYISSLADIAARRFDQAALTDMLQTVERWRESGESESLYRRAAPTILQAHFRVFADWPKLRPLLLQLASRPLEPPQTAILSTLLLQAGEYGIANEIVLLNLRSFPSSQSLWRRRLHILSLLGIAEDLSTARDQMRNQFPEKSYLAAMSIAEPRSWDEAEIPELLNHNLSGKNRDKFAKFVASVTEADLSDSQLRMLRDAAVESTPNVAAQFDLMLAASRDLQLLKQAVSTPVNFRTFRKTRNETAEIVRTLTAKLPVHGPDKLPAFYGMADCLRLTGKLLTGDRLPALFTRESFADAARVAAIMVRRIVGRVPTSIIRLGDGEGHFLQGPPIVQTYLDADRAQIQNIWWGSTRMAGRRLDAIISDFRQAVASSDVLAILPPWRFIAEMHKPDYTAVHRGIHSSIYHVAGIDHAGLIASMHFPNDFHKWGLWDEVFDACDRVSYISCHQLGPFLLEHFGLLVESAIHIPGERQFTGLFGQADIADDDRNALLNRHEEVLESISPYAGQVYLVAAGFLGKIYCDTIKRRGGIGIDIGSLADYWMGFATRRYRVEDRNHVGMLNVHIDDNIVKERSSPDRILGVRSDVRSSGNFRYNISGLLAAPTGDTQNRPTLLVRAIGHPRCGGRYLAGLMQRRGVHVGHEKLLSQGIVSWTHAVRDRNVPVGDNVTADCFTHTIAYVRDPVSAVPSIVLENGKGSSLYFRRQHIMRLTGIDLADYRSPFERAVASFLLWYDIIIQQEPEHVIAVERAETVIDDIVASLRRDNAPAISKDLLFEDVEEVAAGPKPAFGRDDYRGLGVDLKSRLKSFCRRFDYERPW